MASMKMSFFWVVVPCSLVEVYQHFRRDCCFIIIIIIITITLIMEAAGTSEMSVNFYQITRCNNTEDSHLFYIRT
jgi:hypothetical protein